jgi:hypothetical protein
VPAPLREIGAEAANLLLHGDETGEQEAATATLPVSLIDRESTAPKPIDPPGTFEPCAVTTRPPLTRRRSCATIYCNRLQLP